MAALGFFRGAGLRMWGVSEAVWQGDGPAGAKNFVKKKKKAKMGRVPQVGLWLCGNMSVCYKRQRYCVCLSTGGLQTTSWSKCTDLQNLFFL